MKQARLVFAAFAVLMALGVAVVVACDQGKKTQASAAAVSSDASKCPYATAAECQAAKAAAAANGKTAKACPYSASCPHTSAAECKAAMSAAASAKTAQHDGSCPYGSGDASAMTAVAASADGACKHAASATAVTASTAGSCCASKSASASAASADGACKHAASATGVTASAEGGTCGAAKSAAAGGTCSHGAKSAAAADYADGGGAACNGHGMATAAAPSTHADCDACLDMAGCEREIESAGASTQIVPLKNGVMFVYTADSPAGVHAVQAALARRNDRMNQIAAAGNKAHLCGSCKEMRGAQASGKLSREVVNIEGGCLSLVTSNDPSIVAKIHAMAGITAASRVKS